MMRKLLTPLTKDKIAGLKAGEQVLLSGIIYTARDQAHKLIAAALSKGGKPPVELSSCVIYYCGPSGTPEGKVIGSCGPTTSSRMDAFAPLLLEAGVSAIIGQGNKTPQGGLFYHLRRLRRAAGKNGAQGRSYRLFSSGAGSGLSAGGGRFSSDRRY
jgi:tartrate dehydratase beta subunit/fumarate hydratase class I family protein